MEGNSKNHRNLGLKWKKDLRISLKSLVFGLNTLISRRYVDPNDFENIQLFLALGHPLELILVDSL